MSDVWNMEKGFNSVLNNKQAADVLRSRAGGLFPHSTHAIAAAVEMMDPIDWGLLVERARERWAAGVRRDLGIDETGAPLADETE